MTFNFKVAKAIVAHYQFLIGEEIDESASGSYPITHIIIAPNDPDQFAVFINAFNQDGNNQLALLHSGIDTSWVMVLLVHHDTWGGNILTSDIDKYLLRTGGERVYLTPDFLKNLGQ